MTTYDANGNSAEVPDGNPAEVPQPEVDEATEVSEVPDGNPAEVDTPTPTSTDTLGEGWWVPEVSEVSDDARREAGKIIFAEGWKVITSVTACPDGYRPGAGERIAEWTRIAISDWAVAEVGNDWVDYRCVTKDEDFWVSGVLRLHWVSEEAAKLSVTLDRDYPSAMAEFCRHYEVSREASYGAHLAAVTSAAVGQPEVGGDTDTPAWLAYNALGATIKTAAAAEQLTAFFGRAYGFPYAVLTATLTDDDGQEILRYARPADFESLLSEIEESALAVDNTLTQQLSDLLSEVDGDTPTDT